MAAHCKYGMRKASTKKENSADQVYEYIKRQIVTKELYPGNRIVEEEIARATGVSRTPIRSALLRLNYEGLIEQEPNRGAFVARPSVSALRQVYEVRPVLETAAFRAAAQRRSEESVAMMRLNLEQQEQLTHRFNALEYTKLNREFHWFIATEAHNPYYEKYLNELHNKVATYLLFWDGSTDNFKSLDIHQRIYEAFRDRDEEKGTLALMEDIHLGENDICKTQHI